MSASSNGLIASDPDFTVSLRNGTAAEGREETVWEIAPQNIRFRTVGFDSEELTRVTDRLWECGDSQSRWDSYEALKSSLASVKQTISKKGSWVSRITQARRRAESDIKTASLAYMSEQLQFLKSLQEEFSSQNITVACSSCSSTDKSETVAERAIGIGDIGEGDIRFESGKADERNTDGSTVLASWRVFVESTGTVTVGEPLATPERRGLRSCLMKVSRGTRPHTTDTSLTGTSESYHTRTSPETFDYPENDSEGEEGRYRLQPQEFV